MLQKQSFRSSQQGINWYKIAIEDINLGEKIIMLYYKLTTNIFLIMIYVPIIGHEQQGVCCAVKKKDQHRKTNANYEE